MKTPYRYQDPITDTFNRKLEYARKIREAEPELAALMRQQAWEEFSEKARQRFAEEQEAIKKEAPPGGSGGGEEPPATGT